MAIWETKVGVVGKVCSKRRKKKLGKVIYSSNIGSNIIQQGLKNVNNDIDVRSNESEGHRGKK